MAQHYENQCVQCGLPCIGEACRYRKIRVLTCDSCGDEVEKLYRYNNSTELCEECLLKEFEVIE